MTAALILLAWIGAGLLCLRWLYVVGYGQGYDSGLEDGWMEHRRARVRQCVQSRLSRQVLHIVRDESSKDGPR